MAVAVRIPEDRPLTTAEERLIRWLLEHGLPEAAGFIPQLVKARVVSRCPCGCASINLAIGGTVPPTGAGMQILGDFGWQATDGARFGVFVFACAGQLTGLEVWSVDGLTAPSSLPAVGELVLLETWQST
jgi:hypothetical protein